jgi:hypothetical protein
MRSHKLSVALAAALLLVLGLALPAASNAEGESEVETGPSLIECERQAYGFVSSGFHPDPPGSLTRVRARAVLGFMDSGCPVRKARLAIFDRVAGTKRIGQVSSWSKWTTQRQFSVTLRTRRYQCGLYRAAYVQIWFYDTIRTFYKKGARAC